MKKKANAVTVVELSEITQGTMSNSAGFQLLTILDKNFEVGNCVQLSLKGSGAMTSSFLNSSFGELIELYGLDFIKENLTLINYKKSQAEVIKNYLEDVSHYH
ncbi:STAS-like domain-containing protein [Fulvivirga imtechensis]|nr:STAS-like domain-containing protein [Fulvivirga imtechensis]